MKEEDIINEYESLVSDTITYRNTTSHVITRRNRTSRAELENYDYRFLLEKLEKMDKSEWPKDNQDEIYGKLLNVLYKHSEKLLHLSVDGQQFAEHVATYPELIQYLSCVDSIQYSSQISSLVQAVNKNPKVFEALSDEQINSLCENYPAIRHCCLQNVNLPPYNEDAPEANNYITGDPNLIVQLIKCNPELRNSSKLESLIAKDPDLKKRIEIYDLQTEKNTTDITI